MELKENTFMSREDLAAWFKVKPRSFTQSRESKLEDLRDYCDYEVVLTKKGSLKGVRIKEVYCAEYGGAIIKKKFLNWLEAGGLREVADFGGDNVISYPTVVNYYCEKNGIPYDGPHYYKVDAEGRTLEEGRKIQGKYRVENKDYKEWHYLYRQLKRYCAGRELICAQWVDCSAEGFNPTRLSKTTEEQLAIREGIFREVFDEISYTEIMELVEAIEEEDNRDELLETRLMRRMSDQEKRAYAVQKCAERGVLFRKGYEMRGRR